MPCSTAILLLLEHRLRVAQDRQTDCDQHLDQVICAALAFELGPGDLGAHVVEPQVDGGRLLRTDGAGYRLRTADDMKSLAKDTMLPGGRVGNHDL